MKKTLLTLAFILALPITALAAVFNSAQVGSAPVNGYVLQTNGSISTWVATSSLNIASSLLTTTTIWVDVNRTDSYTADGTIGKPYKSISAAFTGTVLGYGAVEYNVAPGVYVEGPPLTAPNIPFVMNAYQVTLVAVSGFTIPSSAFNINGITISGSVFQTNTSLTSPHNWLDSTISGHYTAAGLSLFTNGSLVGGDYIVLRSGQGNILGSFVSDRIITNANLYFNNSLSNRTSNTDFNIVATSTYARLVMIGDEVDNFGTGGGIDCRNGATSSPNEISSIDVNLGVGTPTTSAINCGTAAVSLVKYNANNVAGTQYFANASVFSQAIDGQLYNTGSSTLGWLMTNPYALIGSTTPAYGYLVNDIFDAGGSRNDFIAGNVFNNSNTPCATADFAVNNDTATVASNFGDLGHTSSKFTGSGCVNNPFTGFGANSTYLYDPNGNMNFALGSTTNANYNWFAGGYAASNSRMTLSNGGALSVSSTSATSSIASFFEVGTTTQGSTQQTGNAQMIVQNGSNRTNILQFLSSAGASAGTISNGGLATFASTIISQGGSGFQTGSSFTCTGTICTYGGSSSASAADTIFRGSSAANGFVIIQSTNANSASGDAIKFQGGPVGANVWAEFLSNGANNPSFGIGTTTPRWELQIATTSATAMAPQLTLTDAGAAANQKHWSLESQGGNFMIATSSDSTFATSSTNAMVLDSKGHVDFPGAGIPVLTSCGSGPSPTIVGNDNRFTVTVGGTATGCTVTFSKAFTSVPSCTVTNQTLSVVNAFSYSKTASAITMSQTGLSGDLVDVICQGT